MTAIGIVGFAGVGGCLHGHWLAFPTKGVAGCHFTLGVSLLNGGLKARDTNHQLLQNQYKQTVEELFNKVASFIINDRNDLYLWGNKSTLGKRTLKIPTWVPEWTGHTDDFATEYYNPTFSRLVRGNYSIYGATLHVDVHILDTIEFCWPLESEDIT